MKKLLLVLLFIPLSLLSQSNNTYPALVEAVLTKAGQNRAELEKSISYFKKSGDPLKLKAVYFLISNMDIHYSKDYYWADSITLKRVYFDENSYPDFASAVTAFETIKAKSGNLKPVPYTYRDIDTIKADFLISNIELAFNSWNSGPAKQLSFGDFCEYILPYRVSTEPIQNWRSTYGQKFKWIGDSVKNQGVEKALAYFIKDFKTWFINTWDIEVRKEPLPRLGALQLLSRKKGNCDDIGDLQVFSLRSQGYAAALEGVPYWATTTGRHFFNSTINEHNKVIPFDVSGSVKINDFPREPSKVIRFTYGKQDDVLAAKLPAEKIPPGFLRMFNYRDVTKDYWPTADVISTLFPNAQRPEIAFIAVFNGFDWRPTWWGEINDNKARFKNMSQGAVFLPVYYLNGKLSAAGYPVLQSSESAQVLQPDTKNIRRVLIKEQEKYLKFRPGSKYKLFYWDNSWKLVSEQIALEGSTEISYSGVPKNALLLLTPEYSQRKERPFTIDDSGARSWW
jgi:hypothetical protein